MTRQLQPAKLNWRDLNAYGWRDAVPHLSDPVIYVFLCKSTEKKRAHAADLRREIEAAAHPFHPGIDDAPPACKEGV